MPRRRSDQAVAQIIPRMLDYRRSVKRNAVSANLSLSYDMYGRTCFLRINWKGVRAILFKKVAKLLLFYFAS